MVNKFLKASVTCSGNCTKYTACSTTAGPRLSKGFPLTPLTLQVTVLPSGDNTAVNICTAVPVLRHF
jgi:hypothetical protein